MSAAIVTHASRVPLPVDLAARIADEQADILGIPSFSIAGDANAYETRPTGTLWERVTEWSDSMTDSRGYAVAYYVSTREGYVGKAQGFDTREDAQAWLDSDAGRIHRFFGAQILCGHRFTKSGRIVKVWGDVA